MIHHFIKQFNGAEPTGTVILLTSVAAGFLVPGMSAYSISKLVDFRIVEYLDVGKLKVDHEKFSEHMLWRTNTVVEHPGIRAFAVHPGFVPTAMELDAFAAYTIDSRKLLSLHPHTTILHHPSLFILKSNEFRFYVFTNLLLCSRTYRWSLALSLHSSRGSSSWTIYQCQLGC